MGWNYSFVSFRTSPAVALERLQLKPTGEFSEVLAEAPFAGVMLDSGWYLVMAHNDFRFLERPRLEDLSFDCELLVCGLSEKTKTSQAQAWRNGVLEWSVIHEGSVGRGHMQLEGGPPREVHALLETARANRQPVVDHVFEVPLNLVGSVMDFEFGAGHRFETLVPGAPPWREFHHPDGRVWSIRAGGPGYQLRIGAENDDPVLKERSSGRALRDIEGLVAEQQADGFAPVP